MVESKPYQQRVIEEKSELDVKRAKLAQFKHSSVFDALSWAEQERLDTQAHVMTMYSAILGARIAAFKEE